MIRTAERVEFEENVRRIESKILEAIDDKIDIDYYYIEITTALNNVHRNMLQRVSNYHIEKIEKLNCKS